MGVPWWRRYLALSDSNLPDVPTARLTWAEFKALPCATPPYAEQFLATWPKGHQYKVDVHRNRPGQRPKWVLVTHEGGGELSWKRILVVPPGTSRLLLLAEHGGCSE